MLKISPTNQFKKDYKRELKGQHRNKLDFFLHPILQKLANNLKLDEYNRDHALTGNWCRYRNCHVKPDLVLIYQKTDTDLRLVRLGSHSELEI